MAGIEAGEAGGGWLLEGLRSPGKTFVFVSSQWEALKGLSMGVTKPEFCFEKMEGCQQKKTGVELIGD